MGMSIFEIVGGAIMILISIAACLLVLLQESTKGGGMSALSGSGGDSFFNKNSGRTREALLFRGTKICVIILFVVTIAVYAADILANRVA